MIKISVGVLLLITATTLQQHFWKVVDYWAYGWPLYYHKIAGPCINGGACENTNFLAFIIDIIFWYLVSCAILLPFIAIFEKHKK